MVTLDQHERAQAEVRLLDEQATEAILRDQHARFAALINKAMEEREQAIKAGQQAQEEAQRATHELQRVYNDATAHVQKQDNMLEDAMKESERWSQMALRQEGIARDTEARLQFTEQRLQTLELRANEEFDRLRAAADDFRQEYEVAEKQRAESQGLVDSLIKSEASLQQQVIRLRTECGSGGNSAASAAAQKGLEDELARLQEENHRLIQANKQLKVMSDKYADELFAAKRTNKDRLSASEGDPPGSPEIDRLRKEANDNARLADTYRRQRDKLQADWDAWEHSP
jgi:hypothetical protein